MEHPVATANASKAVSSSPASQTSTALSPRGMSSNAVADVMAQSSRNAPGLATDPARAALQSSVRLRSRLLGQYWPVYFVIRCLVSGVISAGVNTGVAFAMYQGQTDIRLWFFPNVIAGDAAVTVFIQSLIGWNLDGALTFGDVQNGILPVLPGVARWMEKYRITRFYLNHSLQQFKGARDFDPAHRHPRTWRLRRLAGNIFRALLIGAILFPPFWGLLCGIGAAIWGNAQIPDRPGPQIFKAVEGFTLGVIESILISLLVPAQCAKFGDGVNPDGAPLLVAGGQQPDLERSSPYSAASTASRPTNDTLYPTDAPAQPGAPATEGPQPLSPPTVMAAETTPPLRSVPGTVMPTSS